MKKISIVFVVLMLCIGMSASAQFGANKIKLTSGNVKFLKGITELNLEFNFDDMKVGEMNEADYIVKHAAEVDKAKPGKGEEWKKHWVEDRGLKFIPAFIKFFNKRVGKLKMLAATGKTAAKYTLIIKTVKTEPGLYTGVSLVQKDAYIDVVATFIETANPGTELCEITGTYIKGEETYDVGTRITYAYANWGTILGAYITSTIKKMK